jgi:nitrite reductase/ring-hydroxylating ferredoxin subunit
MGGVLAFRNQIGVDHRYAEAGKWSESRIARPPQGLVTVAREDELEVDQMKLLHLGDQRIVLARTENGWAAFSDSCTHRGGSLAGGVMTCGTVICPWHGSHFDVHTGKVSAGPATEPIRSFPITVEGGEVRLDPRG